MAAVDDAGPPPYDAAPPLGSIPPSLNTPVALGYTRIPNAQDALDPASAASDGGMDNSVNSFTSGDNTTATPPLSSRFLDRPPQQELPPLPPALQGPTIDTLIEPSEIETMTAAATASPGMAASSGLPTTSPSQRLEQSIGVLKGEMRELRNADMSLLHRLQELHKEITAYKEAMVERLERLSETNSDYSDFEEDDDMEEIDGQNSFISEWRRESQLQSLVNGDVHADVVDSEDFHPVEGDLRNRLLSTNPFHEASSNPFTAAALITPSNSGRQSFSGPSDPVGQPPTEPPRHPTSLSSPRASLTQLRQSLPPPPPRPPHETQQQQQTSV